MLCKLCLPQWLPAVDAHRKTYHYKKGELIFKEGEKVEGIYFIYSGSVKVHNQWDPDKELIVRIARDGDIAGHRGLGRDIYYPVSGTTLEPTSVCQFSLDFFMATLKVNHEFLFELMMFFAGELKESEYNMRNLVHMPVMGRVARSLLNLHSKFGVTSDGWINISLSRQDLASFSGTTYETVFRILIQFQRNGIIRIEGKNIAIVDIEKLEGIIKS